MRIGAVLLSAIALLGWFDTASAQVIERREGDANPMVAIFKSTVYGAAAGLVVGLAVELVVNDADGEALKWGFVGGTAFGLVYGIYHVSTRPKPGEGSGALLEGDLESLSFAIPRPRLELQRSDPRSPVASTNLEVRVPLAALHF